MGLATQGKPGAAMLPTWPRTLQNQHIQIMANKKVLIVLSDADYVPIQRNGKTEHDPSGFFLIELAKPLQRLLEQGFEVTFASPEGKEPKPDPSSETLLAFAGNFYEKERENELIERMKRENGLARPRKFSEISDDELKGFSGVFLPGGHAPLADLGDNAELGRILRHFHTEHKPTAAICHGPYAFLSTKYAGDKDFAYKGYKISCWSDAEEKMMETLKQGEFEKVESSLRDAGADMQNGIGEKVGYITVDREVASGGNPMAANALGDKFIEMLLAT
ncbi:hypothetical protein LTR10_005855 [Elasticomyces elasticus]|nr:hypothetical protein LTR10_005855 [Elasticomyces elasticus]KAK4965060.1 hypothetical protein LTR42_012479 [Elasticomyces elasticus]